MAGGSQMLNFIITNLQRMIRDKKALIGMLIAPVIALIFFAFAMPSGISYTLEIGVATEEQDEISQQIVGALAQDSSYEIRMMPKDELEEAIETRQLSMGIYIPEKVFENNVEIVAGEHAPYETLRIKINQIIEEIKHPEKKNRTEIIYSDYNQYSKLSYLTGFIINFMMYSLIYITNDILDLKKFRVLKRSFTAPYTGFELLTSLILSMFCLMVLQFSIINFAIYAIFGEFMIKSLLGAIILFVPYIFAILSLGILLGKLTKNAEVTPIVANLIIIPLAMISGTFLPKGMMPPFLENFAFLSPQYWVVNGIDKVNAGNLIEILPNALVLLLLALCLVIASSYKFEKLLEE